METLDVGVGEETMVIKGGWLVLLLFFFFSLLLYAYGRIKNKEGGLYYFSVLPVCYSSSLQQICFGSIV